MCKKGNPTSRVLADLFNQKRVLYLKITLYKNSWGASKMKGEDVVDLYSRILKI